MHNPYRRMPDYELCIMNYALEILPRNPATGVAGHEFLDFCHGYAVVVAVDGVLEARSGNCEVESLLVVAGIGLEAVNQAAHERIAAAHAVNEVGYLVFRRFEEGLAVVENARPVVVVGVDAAAECGDYLLGVGETLHNLL